MPGWQRSRETIGPNRTWVLGRVVGLVWFLTVGLAVLAVGLVIAGVYAVVDGFFTIVLDRPLGPGRRWAYAPLGYGLSWGKYVIGMKGYPGLIPRAEHGNRARG